MNRITFKKVLNVLNQNYLIKHLTEIDSEEPLDDSLVVKNIDKPLHKYAIIYKHDYYNNDKNDLNKQKIKYYLISSLLLFNIIRFSIYIIYSYFIEKRIPDHYFDLIQEVGGLTLYFHVVALLYSLTPLGFIIIFNNASDQQLKWIQIINVLKGFSTVKNLNINSDDAINEFVHHIKLVDLLVRFMFNFFVLISFLLSVIVLLISYNFWRFLKYGIIAIIIHNLWFYYALAIIYFTFSYLYYICFYCKIRMKTINTNIKSINNSFLMSYALIDKLIKDHNNICKTIISYNNFWQKILRLLIGCNLIPFTLIFLHQSMFEDLPFHTLFTAITGFSCGLSILFLIFFITSSVSKEVSKSYKLIYKLLIKFGPIVNTKRKINVIII